MKNLFSIIAVAGMTAIVACGPSAAEKAEKAKQDSIHVADSLNKITMAQKAKSDSMMAADAKKAEMAKMKADSMMKVAHMDSVNKHLIKAEPHHKKEVAPKTVAEPTAPATHGKAIKGPANHTTK
jgi:hypothetical protein